MRDLNPRRVAPYTLSKRAHSATMRILRRRGYRPVLLGGNRGSSGADLELLPELILSKYRRVRRVVRSLLKIDGEGRVDPRLGRLLPDPSCGVIL